MSKQIELPFIRTGHNYDRDAVSQETGIECLDPSKAQQQFRDEADINAIVKRFNLTGELPSNLSVPRYVDFEDIDDYHSAMNLVREADAAFMRLPAELRAMFDNDAGAFVDFVSDPANAEEVAKMGVAPPTSSPADAGGPAQAGGAAPGDGAAAP